MFLETGHRFKILDKTVNRVYPGNRYGRLGPQSVFPGKGCDNSSGVK